MGALGSFGALGEQDIGGSGRRGVVGQIFDRGIFRGRSRRREITVVVKG